MPESAKEGARGLSEGSDIGLGAGGREFESHHSDHLHQKDRLFRRSFCVILSFLKTTLFTSYGLLLLLRPGT